MRLKKNKVSLMEKKRKEMESMAENLKAMEKIYNEINNSETNFYQLVQMLLEQGIKFSSINIETLVAMIVENADQLKKKKSSSKTDTESSDETSNDSSEDTYSVGI